jgi:hypothetical protein
MDAETTPRRYMAAILWPAFLAAGLIEMLVFACVDPGDLRGLEGTALEGSPQAVYTLAFLLFWLLVSGAALLACTFNREPRR